MWVGFENWLNAMLIDACSGRKTKYLSKFHSLDSIVNSLLLVFKAINIAENSGK
jgi:hypothetical protein